MRRVGVNACVKCFIVFVQLQKFARGNQTVNGKHLQSHSSGVVVGLQSRLATMSNEFKQVLQVRTEVSFLFNPIRYDCINFHRADTIHIFLQNLKEQRSRQDQFTQGPVTSTLPPSALTGYYKGTCWKYKFTI